MNERTEELRDIFAALAMQALINQEAATPKWVAHQAYKYADSMLNQRWSTLDEYDPVSHNKENKS